jgi:antitoxin HigA-1
MSEEEVEHPGRVLEHKYLLKLEMSQSALAVALKVPGNRIHEIVNGQRRITPDTDLRLARYLGTAKGYWLDLQNNYELALAGRKLGRELEKITPRAALYISGRGKK